MFTGKCFIRKNTKELQDKLLKLSLKKNPLDDFKGNCLVVNYGMFMSQYRLNELKEYENNEEDIDCGEDENLLLAIAALRDDSDYMQYFVTESDQHWFNQGLFMPKGTFELCLMESRYPKEWHGKEVFCSSVVPSHKASVEELIEHFNKIHQDDNTKHN